MIEKLNFTEFMQRAFRMDTLNVQQRSETEVALRRAIELNPECTALVLFENLQMDSSQFGANSVMTVGPRNTFKSVADCEGKWLRDTPSQRQYPVAFVLVEDVKNPVPVAPSSQPPAPPSSWLDEQKLQSAKAVTQTTYDRRVSKPKKGGR